MVVQCFSGCRSLKRVWKLCPRDPCEFGQLQSPFHGPCRWRTIGFSIELRNGRSPDLNLHPMCGWWWVVACSLIPCGLCPSAIGMGM